MLQFSSACIMLRCEGALVHKVCKFAPAKAPDTLNLLQKDIGMLLCMCRRYSMCVLEGIILADKKYICYM